MLVEAMPIELYVAQRFNEKQTTTIIEDWRIEAEVLEKLIVGYFKEMGIYSVTPNLERQIRQAIPYLLQNSPEIYSRVRKAQAAEALRRQNRRESR